MGVRSIAADGARLILERFRPATLRGHLLLLALAVAVPVTAFAVATVAFVLRLERQAAEQRVLDAARLVAQAVDRELTNAETALRVLARSLLLRQGDLVRFREQALAARTSEEAWIVLFDRRAMQLVNTRMPPNAPLGRRTNPERVDAVFASGRSSVSDLYEGALTKRLILAVDVPVVWDGAVQAVLTQAFFPEYFARVLLEYPVPPGWIVGIFDSTGKTIARSARAADFVGHPVKSELLAAMQRAREGSLEHETREGIRVYDAFTRPRNVEWTIAVAAPVAALDAPVWHALGILGLGALLAFLVAGTLAIVFARRIAEPLGATAEAARALGDGAVPEPVASRMVETRAIGQALHEAGIEIAAANRAKDQFLATVSHELRTPLNAMLGWVWIMRTTPLDEARRTRALETIERNGKAQARLVEDLLDVSRVVAGTLRIEHAPVPLGAVVAGAVDAVRPVATARRLQIAFEAPDRELIVEGDRVRLEQVVVNVLTNAVKFTAPGGHVSVRLADDDGMAELTVRDDGVGIAPDVLPYVFDQFRQADQSSTRRFGGLGLGLTIVKQLIELHGGTVRAESPGVDLGATFVVRLPIARREDTPPVGPATPASASPATLSGLRVLAVDDDADNLELLEAQLRLAGAEVVATRSARHAVEEVTRRRPDAVVTDIGMPNQDGYWLLQQIGGAVPVIALTAFGRRDEYDRALAAGFSAHLSKPIDADKLVAVVLEVLAARR